MLMLEVEQAKPWPILETMRGMGYQPVANDGMSKGDLTVRIHRTASRVWAVMYLHEKCCTFAKANTSALLDASLEKFAEAERVLRVARVKALEDRIDGRFGALEAKLYGAATQQIPLAPCPNCATMPEVKRELGRIRRQLLDLAERLDTSVRQLK